ncbi:MAG: 1,4-alpha-glucan branching protein GlgB [Saprospiraceae bacterium]|nr:1,4-alpha-glucan branching protein GlgB [Saprospiraceae bacterium]
MNSSKVISHTLLSDFDIYLFRSGKHYRIYEKMGSHLINVHGVEGCYFAVYAPMAEKLSVVGDFNHWKGDEHILFPRWDGSGIWEGFIPGVQKGMVYKYRIQPYNFGRIRMKADPYAIKAEKPPLSGSVVWKSEYKWNDDAWMKKRVTKNGIHQPHSVYEMHFGSWMRHKYDNRSLSYIEMADKLVSYITEMGYTHVEFMPLAEHPYEPSWGYQVTGFFAASSRFGHPEELMLLIDKLHQADIGVIMDWVPAHFPSDDFALATFDGSCVYEHPDRRKGFHPDWNTLIFNFERSEIRSFLISNAFFWLEKFHIDGLRVDAVSSIAYLDYSRKEGEWEPNQYGGRENLDAISFLQEFNTAVYGEFPGVQTIAEESTDYPMVSRPVYQGGLGFGMKWMMGWMHDTLNYFKREFEYRKFHQNDITFSIMYAFSENFMLALSHDEVVHGKSSLVGKMSGDAWQKFANLRTLYGYMFTHPGTKLLFMGNDIGPYTEWNFKSEVPWELLEFAPHKGLNNTVKTLNKLYRSEKALYHFNFSPDGYEWLDAGDRVNSILSYYRKSDQPNDKLMIIHNLNVTPHKGYKFGLSEKENYTLIFNSDEKQFHGSNYEIRTNIKSIKQEWHGKNYMLELDIPPLCTLIYKIVTVKKKSSTVSGRVKEKLSQNGKVQKETMRVVKAPE